MALLYAISDNESEEDTFCGIFNSPNVLAALHKTERTDFSYVVYGESRLGSLCVLVRNALSL